MARFIIAMFFFGQSNLFPLFPRDYNERVNLANSENAKRFFCLGSHKYGNSERSCIEGGDEQVTDKMRLADTLTSLNDWFLEKNGVQKPLKKPLFQWVGLEQIL